MTFHLTLIMRDETNLQKLPQTMRMGEWKALAWELQEQGRKVSPHWLLRVAEQGSLMVPGRLSSNFSSL